MTPQTDFSPVFNELKSIIAPYAKKLNVTVDTKEVYSMDGPYSENGNGTFSSHRHKSRRITYPFI